MVESRATAIAKTAVVESNVSIGMGTKIMHGAYISRGTVIGKNCFIGYNTIVRPNVRINDNTEIRSLCFVAEGVQVGSNCKIIQLSNLCKNLIIEDSVFLGTGVLTYDTKKISHNRNYDPFGEPPVIKYGARIGSGVRINPGIIIERFSMIDAASVVTKNTEVGGIYRGTPAIKIGKISIEEMVLKHGM